MNLEGEGIAIAILKNTKSKNIPILYVDNENNAKSIYCDLKLKNAEMFQQIPNPESERQILYITGRSGSGKSYYTKKYLEEYKKMYPKNEIYVFSALDEDPSLDSLKDLKRIKLTEELLGENLEAKDFKNSIVIFDDTDCLTSKKILKKVDEIKDSILQTGRHYNVSCIITTHTACNGGATKVILNESHSVTIFPAGLGNRSLKYLLDSYLGLDKSQIKKIKNLNSRWITIIKSFPMIILSEKEAYVLKNDIQ